MIRVISYQVSENSYLYQSVMLARRARNTKSNTYITPEAGPALRPEVCFQNQNFEIFLEN